jgi:hypothetical protein
VPLANQISHNLSLQLGSCTHGMSRAIRPADLGAADWNCRRTRNLGADARHRPFLTRSRASDWCKRLDPRPDQGERAVLCPASSSLQGYIDRTSRYNRERRRLGSYVVVGPSPQSLPGYHGHLRRCRSRLSLVRSSTCRSDERQSQKKRQHGATPYSDQRYELRRRHIGAVGSPRGRGATTGIRAGVRGKDSAHGWFAQCGLGLLSPLQRSLRLDAGV